LPVCDERGRGGGWRLLGGGRTDLSGLTAGEARALFLVAEPAAAVSREVRRALRKLVRALPEPLRERAEASAAAVTIDNGGWGSARRVTRPVHLDALQAVAVEGQKVRLGYRGPMTRLALAPGAGFQVGSDGDLDRYLGAVAAAGFEGVSLSLQQAGACVSMLPTLLARHGLRCSDVLSLAVTRHDDEVLAAARGLAGLAEAAGAEFVLSLFFTRVSEESLDRYGRCADIVAAAGAKLALEMPPIGELDSITAALGVVDAIGRDRCCIMVDTFHFSRGSSTWEELRALPLDALGYVQFDDALPAITDDVMFETMDRRAMPGDGELDLHRFSDLLIERGWSGWVSVEVLSAELRELEVEEFARRAYATSAPYWLAGSAEAASPGR